MRRLWRFVTAPWRRREQSKQDMARRVERIERDDARVAELTARHQRIIRENHLGPDIMRALGVRGGNQ